MGIVRRREKKKTVKDERGEKQQIIVKEFEGLRWNMQS